MSENAIVGGYGRISWRRFGLILMPAAAVAIVLVVLTAQSVLAVSFAISGVPFTVTASGTVSYAPALDVSAGGFLSGAGSTTLTVVGFPVTIDASTLTGTVEGTGGFTLSHGGQSVRLTNFILDTPSRRLTALLARSRSR